MGTRRSSAKANPAGEAITVPASEVKNSWHEIIERVSQAREEIVVTRYGRPAMRLVPIDAPETTTTIFGCMAGTVTVHGDIVAPVEERWEAGA